jgi:hypothetical protein
MGSDNRITTFMRVLVITSLYFLTISLQVCNGSGPLPQLPLNVKNSSLENHFPSIEKKMGYTIFVYDAPDQWATNKAIIGIGQEVYGSTVIIILSEKAQVPQFCILDYISNPLVFFIICILLGIFLDRRYKEVDEIKEGNDARNKRWRRLLTIITALETPVFLFELIQILLHFFNRT